MKPDLSKRLVGWLIACLLFAISLYLAGTIFKLPLSDRNVAGFTHAVLTDGLRDLAVAIGTAVILALGVDLLMHKDLLSRINERFLVVKAASNVGLENILVRRTRSVGEGTRPNEEFNEWLLAVLSTQLGKNSGEIKIICVAAPEYLNFHSPIGVMFHDYYVSTRRLASERCKLRILYQNPDCDAARTRASLESNFSTLHDIRASVSYLTNLMRATSEETVSFRGYSRDASLFMVMTEACVCLEPLPISTLEHLRGPLGGHTPLCVYGSDRHIYGRWQQHFEYLWEMSAHDSTNIGQTSVNPGGDDGPTAS